MSLRAASVFAFVIALSLGWSSTARADEIVVECKVLKVEANRVWAVGPCDRPVPFEVSAKALVTIDGKAVDLRDLPPGLGVVMTIVKGEKGPIVVRIEG
jgi:hypothetical protein